VFCRQSAATKIMILVMQMNSRATRRDSRWKRMMIEAIVRRRLPDIFLKKIDLLETMKFASDFYSVCDFRLIVHSNLFQLTVLLSNQWHGHYQLPSSKVKVESLDFETATIQNIFERFVLLSNVSKSLENEWSAAVNDVASLSFTALVTYILFKQTNRNYEHLYFQKILKQFY